MSDLVEDELIELHSRAVCLGLGAAAAAGITSPEWLRQFTSEGLIIVGWIALWHPVDMLLFEQWPVAREIRIVRQIREREVKVLVTGSEREHDQSILVRRRGDYQPSVSTRSKVAT